jgi:hypothetical protein
VFWVKNKLKNKFLGQKNINPDFPVIAVARLEKTGDVSAVFFFKKKGGRHIVHPRGRIKKRAQSYGLATCLGSPVVGPGERG